MNRAGFKSLIMNLVGNRRCTPLLPAPWSNQRICFVDVGARGGPPSNWTNFLNQIYYVCFEPDPAEAETLRRFFGHSKHLEATVVEAALGSSRGSGELYLTRYPPSSSFFQPNFEFLNPLSVSDGYRIEQRVEVDVLSLDEVLKTIGQQCDFLKIDVQGYELKVLQGGIKSLAQAMGCELEVSFREIYKNQPLFADIDQWMRAHGFFLADLERFWWRRKAMPRPLQERGTLAYGNAVYLKEKIFSPKDLNEAARSVLICLALGLDEVAYEVVMEAYTQKWISRGQKDEFKAWIRRRRKASDFWFHVGRLLKNLPGRQTLGRWLGLWSRALHGNSDTGSDADSWNRRTSW